MGTKIVPIVRNSANKLLSHAKQVVEKWKGSSKTWSKKSGRATRIKEEAAYYPIASDVAWEKVIQIEINQNSYPGIRVTPRPKGFTPAGTGIAHPGVYEQAE